MRIAYKYPLGDRTYTTWKMIKKQKAEKKTLLSHPISLG